MSETNHMNNGRPPQVATHRIAPDASPAPSSASNRSPLSPGSGIPLLSPISRPPAGMMPVQYQGFHPLGPSPRQTGLPQPFYGGAIGMPQQPTLPGYHEISNAPTGYGEHPHSQVGTSMQSQQGQKRAYRQRRKDPSCDACRERKVKCDATDSSSCTECKSRNVNCQFTKETNRRMTSIKQNQDLSKELASAQAEISRLNSLLVPEKSVAQNSQSIPLGHLPVPGDDQLSHHDLLHLPVHNNFEPRSRLEGTGASERPFKRRKLGDGKNAGVGATMARVGHDIFKSPYAEQEAKFSDDTTMNMPELPRKEIADQLMRQYRYTIHLTIPVVNWKTFEKQYERVYREGLREATPSWTAFLFAVLACGTMHRSWADGQKFQEKSKCLLDIWTEKATLDHVRAALLNSLFMVESNAKSAGWIWTGIAVRYCFDLGLNCDVGTWDPIEQELRRRVWWSTYACDCLLALELGRIPIIKEEDCSVPLPSPVSDEHIDDDNAWMSPTPDMNSTALLPTIHVVGPIARLFRLMKLSEIPADTLQTYDLHFQRLLGTFPKRQQPYNPEYVDPVEIFHLMYLQNARLILHRHNLTPVCDLDTRTRAIDNCANVARSTAMLLRKCMQDPPGPTNPGNTETRVYWEERIMSSASAFVCMHIWRCTLFLLLGLDLEAATTCVKFGSILGDLRAVNVACGRYLEFFLSQLIQKKRSGYDLGGDEDLIAYASGDLQGGYESSWVWQDIEEDKKSGGFAPVRSSQAVDTEVAVGWSGWDGIVKLIKELSVEVRRPSESRIPTTEEVRMPPIQLPPLTASPSPSAANTPRDRLSIKDLM